MSGMTGYCPTCYLGLSNVMVDGFGYCEAHGRVAAEWNRLPAQEHVVDMYGRKIEVGDWIVGDDESGDAEVIAVTKRGATDYDDETGRDVTPGPRVIVVYEDGTIEPWISFPALEEDVWVCDDVEVDGGRS